MSPPALPWVRTLALKPPSLSDNTADADRLAAALRTQFKAETVAIDLELLARLPGILRGCGYRVRCTVWREPGRWVLTGVDGADTPRPACGVAVDLGTSRVALMLIDLSTGRTLAETSCDNPQIAIGPDVLTRIHHAESGDGLAELKGLIIDGVNAGIADLCRGAGIEPTDIHTLAVAGNTAMTHLFLGLPPRSIIREPYTPAVNRPGVLRAADLGLAVGACARVLVFPNIGSYFGGDLIAGILFSRLHRRKETALLVDVGTNAEVVLGNEHWLIGCAGAAGPALEGGVTQMGMMAGAGRGGPRGDRPAYARIRPAHDRRQAPPRHLRLGGDRPGRPALCSRNDRHPRQARPRGLRRTADGDRRDPPPGGGRRRDLRHRPGAHHRPGRPRQPGPLQGRHVHDPRDPDPDRRGGPRPSFPPSTWRAPSAASSTRARP